jgi:ABC-2 type transport system permease protein
MSQSVPASSSSSRRWETLREALQAIIASWRAKLLEHVAVRGAGGYILIWVAIPVFQLATVGLIYRHVRPNLVAYTVVSIAASTFVTNAQYYIGQVLDEERLEGTLISLFLAPCPRLSWLTGFALGGLLETFLAAAGAVIFGHVAFGVQLDPNYPALILTFTLFLASLWGLGFVFSALGLILKRSNDLANLVDPFLFLLGGILYPVALLPLWLQIPARVLPLGYGMQALASATLHHASITDLAPQLLPLAGFAVVLPIIGIQAFSWIERRVRQRGDLELY